MKNCLGDIIAASRRKMNLTQDQYGARYHVTGPAIFKFEKGSSFPSLDLWLKLAADADLSERRAVLLLAKSKLPDAYQPYIELQPVTAAEMESENAKKKGVKPDYSLFESQQQMREIAAKDKTLPKALKELLADDELWMVFKPTGSEINMLRDSFGPLGKGSKVVYREALRLIREFAHSF